MQTTNPGSHRPFPRTQDSGRKNLSAASYIFLSVLTLYVLMRCVVFSAARPLWFDEILTFAVSSQPSFHGFWSAISKGFDAQPPPFYLFERMALKLPVSADLALRLGSILGFPALLVSVFLFIWKRTEEIAASVGALALLATSLFYLYSIEARGYSLVSACIAFAMVCYQRVPSRRWTILLGLSLIVAVSFHYYAIFAVVPFVFAEVVYWCQNRRLRWFVWTALLSAVVPLCLCWRLLFQMRSFYGSQFFAVPVAAQVPRYYGSYFVTDSVYGLALLLLSLAVGCGLFFGGKALAEASGRKKTPAPEVALLLGLILLPFLVYLGARLSHGQMLDRYALPSTIAVVVTLVIGVSYLSHRGLLLALVSLLVIGLVGRREFQAWSTHTNFLLHSHSVDTKGEITAIQAFIEKGGYNYLPVVFSHPLKYCQLRFYAPRAFTDRLVALNDRSRELRFEGTDSMFRAMGGLAGYFPARLENYDEFMATHSEFLFYAETSEWSSVAVTQEAKSIQIVEMELGRQLLLIRTRE